MSGPMTGYPEWNYPAFESACQRLRAFGYEVVSPHEVNPADLPPQTWGWYMRRDIVALMDCDLIVVLPGWETSTGAGIETGLGIALGMRVVEFADALAGRVPA